MTGDKSIYLSVYLPYRSVCWFQEEALIEYWLRIDEKSVVEEIKR